jgi:hypothetical protein
MTQDDAQRVETDNSARRVKLYILDEEEWLDQGTGHVGLVQKTEPNRSTTLHLVIVLEGTDEILLDTRVEIHANFEHQDDTLILWNDVESGKDFALSFQDKEGCFEIYASISEFFKSLGYVVAEKTKTLPSPSVLSLDDLAKFLDYVTHEAQHSTKSNVMDEIINDAEWFEKLIDLVDPLTDLLEENASDEELVDVRLLVHCVKTLLFFNDARLWSVAANAQYAPSILKIFECTFPPPFLEGGGERG